nr:MAG TPA: hypothetical protein [Caudoviricetes sp.]
MLLLCLFGGDLMATSVQITLIICITILALSFKNKS